MIGVGDLAPEEDVLRIFVVYAEQKGSVETNSDQWADLSGKKNNFTSRGGSGFCAQLGHIEQGLVNYLREDPVGEG